MKEKKKRQRNYHRLEKTKYDMGPGLDPEPGKKKTREGAVV